MTFSTERLREIAKADKPVYCGDECELSAFASELLATREQIAAVCRNRDDLLELARLDNEAAHEAVLSGRDSKFKFGAMTTRDAVAELVQQRDAARAELAALHARIEQSHNGYQETGKSLGMDRPASHLIALGELLTEQVEMADSVVRMERDEARAELAEARRQRDELEDAIAIAIAAEQPKRDWPEDAADADNGQYQCSCSVCGASFVGHKRRVECKVCAEQPKPAGGS